MQLKTSLKVLMLSMGLFSLVACSTTSPKGGDGVATTDLTGGDGAGAVRTAGVGDDASFSGQLTEGDVGRLEVGNQTYYFDFNKSNLHDEDMPSIKVQAKYLATHAKAKVVLEGHTDPRGSREYNIALGERRANSVADALKLAGVGAEQIRVVSYGAEKLAVPGHTDADYAKDRRVHLAYEAK